MLSFYQKEQLNNQAEIIVNQLDYYETGQLKSKKIHSADNGATFVQKVDYGYNIKGWLTKINNPASLGNDLFAMKLDYTESPNKEYNGNIAAIKWASATYTDIKTYTFAYDKLSRLSSAAYSEAQNRDYSMDVSYDLNGNIATLNRKGRLADGSFGNIDNLVYTYKNGGLSNRLDRVDDANTTNNQNHGFSDLGAWLAGEYNYDNNGNMTEDKNRQITQITYNNMDLPVHITFAGATQTWLQNTYLAGGAKLRKENPDGKTDYIGSFIYENDELKYIQNGGGRIVVNGANYERQYYLTDHLGNVRVTFDTQCRVLQEDSYYPLRQAQRNAFGMAQEGLNYVNNTLLDIENKNKYLYNGKEQDGQTKFFEYGFRDYDAQLGRWHVRDPMAETYANQSPYHFAGNNPVGNREINGAVYQRHEREEWERGVNESGVLRGSSSLDNAIGQADAYDASVYNYSANRTYLPGVGSVSKNDVVNVYDSQYGGSLSEALASVGISGYYTSVNGQVQSLYIDGIGEVYVNDPSLLNHNNQEWPTQEPDWHLYFAKDFKNILSGATGASATGFDIYFSSEPNRLLYADENVTPPDYQGCIAVYEGVRVVYIDGTEEKIYVGTTYENIIINPGYSTPTNRFVPVQIGDLKVYILFHIDCFGL